jgi:hypothetical protein
MARKDFFGCTLKVDGVRHWLGKWPTRKEALIARDRALLHFGVDKPLAFPRESRRLGPISPEDLRRSKHEAFKATTASRFQGVHKSPKTDGWYAIIIVDDRIVFLGAYPRDGELAAAEAVDRACRFHGRPQVNFPERRLAAKSPALLRKEQRLLRGTSKYFGVTSVGDSARPWRFQLTLPGGLHVAVTGYKTDKLAAIARDRAVIHYGVDSPVNFPEEARKAGPVDVDTLRREVRAKRKRHTTSRYRGVTWQPARSRWTVKISALGVWHFVGYFKEEREAAEAYDAAAKRYLGAKAARRLNFP